VIPLVVVLHPADVAVLTGAVAPDGKTGVGWDTTLAEVIAVLRLHAGSILPTTAATYASSSAVYGAGLVAGSAKTGRGAVRAMYHARNVSVSWEVRATETRYVTLCRQSTSVSSGGSGGLSFHSDDDWAALDDDAAVASLGMRSLPVAGYTLIATVRHKASEVERRRAAAAVAAAGVVPVAAAHKSAAAAVPAPVKSSPAAT